jgi:simple sugar transport system permease protein
MLADLISLAFLAQMLRMGVPFVLAAVGGTLSERAGVINIALEGKLLLGAFFATLGTYASGSPLVGAACGAAGGVAVAALYALVVVRFRADQIVAGVAINLLAFGLARTLLKLVFDSAENSPRIAGLAGHPLAEPLFWLAALAVVGAWWAVARTVFGLRLRAVGDHPEAAASVGVSVARVRWAAVLLAGGLAGAGGAWLALANQGFKAEISNGRGYIALAAVVMGKWRPLAAALACLLFAFAEALQVNLQASSDLPVPHELLQMLPYLLTIVALAGFIGRARPPASLGKPLP